MSFGWCGKFVFVDGRWIHFDCHFSYSFLFYPFTFHIYTKFFFSFDIIWFFFLLFLFIFFFSNRIQVVLLCTKAREINTSSNTTGCHRRNNRKTTKSIPKYSTKAKKEVQSASFASFITVSCVRSQSGYNSWRYYGRIFDMLGTIFLCEYCGRIL